MQFLMGSPRLPVKGLAAVDISIQPCADHVSFFIFSRTYSFLFFLVRLFEYLKEPVLSLFKCSSSPRIEKKSLTRFSLSISARRRQRN